MRKFVILLFFIPSFICAQSDNVKAWVLGSELAYEVRHNNDQKGLLLIDSLFLTYPDYYFAMGFNSAIKCLKRNDQELKAKLIFLLGKERGILKVVKRSDTIQFPQARDTLIKYLIEDQGKKAIDRVEKVKLLKAGYDYLFDETSEDPFHIYKDRHKIGIVNIMDSIGYPTIDKVGVHASKAMFILLLHEEENILEKYKEEFKENSTPQGYAYFIDKLKVHKGLPQVYGTQSWAHKSEKRPTFYRIEIPTK